MRIIMVMAVVILASVGMLADEPHMHIYRNDGRFTTIYPVNGMTATHSADSETATFTWNDGENITLPLNVIDSCTMRMSDIPTLYVSLKDYPDVTMLWDKDLYLSANLDIAGHGSADNIEGLSLNIKGRGNSTWSFDKKPMRMKFAKKTSICGFEKSKNYVLLANYIDNSLMKNAMTMWLARKLQMTYANSFVPVDVVLNGHNLGSYLLTEKIGINSSSIDIDENTGVLLELSIEYDEKYKFRSNIFDLPVMIKDPDFDELSEENPDGPTPDERLALWQSDFNKAELLAYQNKASDAFDIESAVKYFLVNNFALNSEIGYPKSFYLYKEDLAAGTKYKLGPVWDFDVCYNLHRYKNGVDDVALPTSTVWGNRLINTIKKSKEFRVRYVAEVENFVENIMPELLTYFDSYAAAIEPSAKRDGLIWDSETDYGWTYRTSAYETKKITSELRQWMIDRAAFLLEQAHNDNF